LQWRRVGFYGSCLRARQFDSELAWPVPQALMVTHETSSYESSSCLPSCRPGVTPSYSGCVHCTSTGQLARSCLQMFLNRASVSRFKAAWAPQCQPESLLRPGPGLPCGGPGRRSHGRRGRRSGSTPAAADTSRRVTRLRGEHTLIKNADIQFWYVQDTVVVVPPYPYCIEEDRLDVDLEDCWYARPQLFFKCYLRPKHGREPKNGTYKVGPGMYMYIHVYMCMYGFLTIVYQMICCENWLFPTPLGS
jgi:hypothetical protein